MTSTIFILYGLVQLALCFFAIYYWRKNGQLLYLILPIVAAALAYDNTIIGLGHTIGEGATLETLNSVRYYSHVFFTPLLCIIGLLLARNAGIEWAWRRQGTIAVYVIALVLIGVGFYLDVTLLQLEASTEGGTLRYANIGWEGPPIAAIMTMAVLLFVGMSMLVSVRWLWLLIGSLAMFIISGFAATIGILANFGEILLIVSILFTMRQYPYITYEDYQETLRQLSSEEKRTLAEAVRNRKKRLAVHNRRMAWVMLPVLIIGTAAFYRNEIGMPSIPQWVDYTFNTLFILLFFIHAVASFYFYGLVKPRKHIRVVHVYIGYGVFIFTMISQSLIGIESIATLQFVTYIINWLFIGAHVALSTRFWLKRRQRNAVTGLDFRVKVRETTKA